MINKVEQYPVSSIFDVSNKAVYKIPKYQREYKWGTSEWDQLFNDIIANDNGYFLGSYICVGISSKGRFSS